MEAETHIINLYVKGKLSKKDASEYLGISERTFERRLTANGYSTKTHIRNKKGVYFAKNNLSLWKNLYENYLSGKSLKELALEIEINKTTLAEMLFDFHKFSKKSKEQIKEEKIEKTKNTWLDKYGVDHPFKTREGLEKLKKANRIKYGVDNVMQLKEVQEKAMETTLKNYGVKRPLQNKELKKKQEKTLKDNLNKKSKL